MPPKRPTPQDFEATVTAIHIGNRAKKGGGGQVPPGGGGGDDDAHFEAHSKEHFHDEHAGGGHGGTEMGWLVSYADMMTLLFGLFVILFSITTDKSKNVNDVMMQVSKKFFTNQDGDQFTPSGKLPPKDKAPEVPVKDPAAETEAAEAKFEAERDQYKKKIDELKAEVDKLEQEKTEAKKEKKSTQLKLAAVDDPTSDLKKQIEEMKGKIADHDKLQDKLEDKTKEADKLRDELYKNKQSSKNYMMVLVTWETEKHDVDMEVTTPQKHKFNFKKRKVAGEPGAFELDSRFGPGIEMWKAESFLPGEYHTKVSLYNKNGNDKPAKVQLTVVTNLSSYKSAPIELTEANRDQVLNFAVDAEGNVEFKDK